MLKKILILSSLSACIALGACVPKQQLPANETTTETTSETIEISTPEVFIDDNDIKIDDLLIHLPEEWEKYENDDFLFEAGNSEDSITIANTYNGDNSTIDDLLANAQEELINIGAQNLSLTKQEYEINEKVDGIKMEYEIYGKKIYQTQLFIPQKERVLVVTLTSPNDNIDDLIKFIF